jgi:prephenate dehydrogenase
MNLHNGLRIGVMGLGQIGGSIAMRLKTNGNEQVIGYDLDDSLMQTALRRSIVDTTSSSASDLIEVSDFVIIALPIAGILATLERFKDQLLVKKAVTDTGSLKLAVTARAREFGLRNFIGGHPLAGTELRGALSWNARLFEGANYFITTNADTDPESMSVVTSLVKSLGASPKSIAADIHDDIFASTSNLPHLLAYLLTQQYVRRRAAYEEAEFFRCPSFNGATRVAKSDPEMVFQMLWHNQAYLRTAVRELAAGLEEIVRALEEGDETRFHRLFVADCQ